MKPATLEALEALDRVEWFRAVGQKDSAPAIQLSSWPDALEFCTSATWRGLGAEAANQYRQGLARASPERLRLWNAMESELRPSAASLVQRKTEHVAQTNQLPKMVIDRISWDILHFALETEHADICPTGFFTEQASWYLKGHFPCGRMGNKLTGRPIVY